MLKGISPILGPDMLHVLQSMGHGDELVIADANFPGSSTGPHLVRMDGHSVTEVLEAVLSLFPLDQYDDSNAIHMQVVGDPDRQEPIFGEFQAIMDRHEPGHKLTGLERFQFYDRAADAFAVVQTGERRLYGNIIIKKGVVQP